MCQCPLEGSRCESIRNPCYNSDGTAVCKNFGICSLNLAIPPYYECSCLYGSFGTNCESLYTTTTQPTTTSTLSPATTTSRPFLCVDAEPVACLYYANNNLCSNYYTINGGTPVPTYCPKACGLCTSSSSQPNGPCADTQNNCALWSMFNLCYKLSHIVPHPCQKSCKLC